MSGQLNELRLQVERLDYDNKESIITIDTLKEQNQDAKNELEELKKTIADLKVAQKDASAEDKEKRKQEKMALMMAKFDAVRSCTLAALNRLLSHHHSTARHVFRERRAASSNIGEAGRHRGRRRHCIPVARRHRHCTETACGRPDAAPRYGRPPAADARRERDARSSS